MYIIIFYISENEMRRVCLISSSPVVLASVAAVHQDSGDNQTFLLLCAAVNI